MNHADKGNVKLISRLLIICALILLTLHLDAQVKRPPSSLNDPVIINTDSSGKELLNDTTKKVYTQVSVDTFNFKSSKNALDAPIHYHADDSMVIDVPSKKMFLYGKTSKIEYIDNVLTAPQIQFDQKTNLVTAFLTKDSLGKVVAYPTFTQGDFKSKMDTIQFSPKTLKGITKGTYTQQGEMFVYGERIKKISNDVFYAFRSRFTTCNLDTPHFAFVSKRIKLVNQKMAYSGMVHPEFEGVPIPIYLPFGIYPLQQGRHSGLLAPSFAASQQLGISLENLGYYKILSDNWDVVVRGTVYSYGSWTTDINPRYYKRYRYRGNFSVNLQRIKNSSPGDPDNSAKTFKINWRHDADTKARPGVTFGAFVTAGSTRFNEQTPNNPNLNFQNQMTSSINYRKAWNDKPYVLTVAANHSQNSATRIIQLDLPQINFSVNTINPFRKKEPVGASKWYESIGIGFNSDVQNRSNFIDTAGNIPQQLKDNYTWGARHTVPLNVSLPAIGPFFVTPTIGYSEHWYQRKFQRVWNAADKTIDTLIRDGFYTARQMDFGLGANTRIFGMFGFNKSSKVQAIRHEIRPSISLNYTPNMNRKNYYNVQVDTIGNIGRYSFFENSFAGAFSENSAFRLGFSIDNNVSMKVKNKKDTAEALKKINLLDGLSLTGNYDFFADSLNLSQLSLSARTNLFNKINITANALIDPYKSDSTGRRINRLVWKDRFGSLGDFTSGRISLQSSFRGGNKKNPGAPVMSPGNTNNVRTLDPSGRLLNEYEQEQLYMQNNPGEFVDFSIPWDINFNYSLLLSRIRRPGNNGTFIKGNQNIDWNASVSLTERWKLGINGVYNITEKDLGQLAISLSREMHCWQMTINIAPVGIYRFFTINISPKSGLLRDLKINRTRFFYDR